MECLIYRIISIMFDVPIMTHLTAPGDVFTENA